MMDIIKQIQNFTLFKGISAENLKLLVSRATQKRFKQGELLIGETDPIRAFYVVTSGQLKLYKSSSEGKEQTLSLLRQGYPFGLCTAFITESFPANAMAIEESAVLNQSNAILTCFPCIVGYLILRDIPAHGSLFYAVKMLKIKNFSKFNIVCIKFDLDCRYSGEDFIRE